MLRRVQDPAGWAAWTQQLERAGHCRRPVRISGRAQAVDTTTGEVVAEYGTAGQPDGTLLVACKDRRAAVCPACAETYRADTWHVVAAGLRGRTLSEIRPGLRGHVAGGAVPASVVTHPVVLATFTAPPFGLTHSTHGGKRCRPRRDRPKCRHGAPAWCGHLHDPADRGVGSALCADCYDYPGHVLWHGALPELWETTITYLYRALARAVTERRGVRVSVTELRRWLRVSYVKVAEWQQRAVVHLHVVIRLDGVNPDDPADIVEPPLWVDAALLEVAVRDAGARAAVALPVVRHRERSARWGTQLDVTPITVPERAAAYVAKYATKSAGDTLAGLPATPFPVTDLTGLVQRGVSAHVGLLVLACHRLDRLPDCAALRLAKHAHTLGYGGHFSTKSRYYSTTLGKLRAARRSWRAAGNDGDVWAAGDTAVVGAWRLVGVGFGSLADSALASTLARDHAAGRQARRDGTGGDPHAA